VQQLTLQGPLYKCIPDVVLLRQRPAVGRDRAEAPGVPARQGFDENLTSYKHPQNGVPRLFAHNALLIAVERHRQRRSAR
jgi:type I restriction enzyme R subunit